MKKLLFLVGDGIGNQTETIPALIYCKERYKCPIDVYNSIPRNTESTQVIFTSLADKIYVNKEKVNTKEYFGQVLSYPFFQKKVSGIAVKSSNVSNLREEKKYSEIDMNLRAVGSKSKAFDFKKCDSVFNWINPDHIVDIVLHNGYSKVSLAARKAWEVKSYPHYEKLAQLLIAEGFTVGSIGSAEEYIEGTEDLTGISLIDSLSTIKGSSLFISNDTSTYHLANLLCKKNIVLFTATDHIKNFDTKFHRYSTIVRRSDLPCQPCQLTKKAFHWNAVKETCGWECRNIDPNLILEKAKELI